MFKNYVKTAFRTLSKNKAFTAINIAGLALGLTAFLLILFYVIDEFNFDRYNTQSNKIFRVNSDINFGGAASSLAITPMPLAAALVSNFPEVKKAVRLLHDVGVRIKKGSEIIQEDKVVYSDPNIFEVFTLPMLTGNPKTALTEPNTVVITASTAKRYFNKTDVVGQTLLINNHALYKITGVIRDIPAQSHFNFDFFLSLSSNSGYRNHNWFNYLCTTYVLLNNQADSKKLEAKLPDLIRKATVQQSADFDYKAFEKSGNYFKLNLTPLTDIHLQSNRQYELGINGNLQYVYIFSAIALFILLIACINFINLSTARSSTRAKEVGVRKVLGSSRKNLMAQFLSESILVTLAATLIAFFTAWLLLPLFNQLSSKSLVLSLHTFFWLLPLLLLLILIIGIVAGAYPAVFLSGFQPVQVLKGRISAGFKNGGLRSFLVIFQFSISIFLIIGTLIIYHQLKYIQNKNLGFNRNQVLIIKNTSVLSNAKILKQEIKQLPGVVDATLSSFLPTTSNRNPDAVFTTQIATPKSALMTEIWSVDEDYLRTMGMSLVKGRNFSSQFLTDSSGIIMNEAAAKMLGYQDQLLNKKLYFHPQTGPMKEYHVLGILKDFNFNSLRSNVSPVVMVLAEDRGAISIRVKPGNIQALIGEIETKWKALSPDQHFDYSFMDEDFNALYRSEQRIGKIFIVFTSLAILIACLGLFGLAAFAAEQRTKEIGIRKVLGASVSGIVGILSAEFIKPVLIAILISSPISWFLMNKWLQDFAYRINISWWIFVLAGTGAIMIALLTVSFQAIKAALANPVKSLRSE